ncbi:DUF1501 domain-containing protein [Verrucomicrobium spinosum]|uniref:DUF1501 domain-containing protein n=1 Tax=Verrucomicrobium spinosum TaxID=2736 RepID=UPI000174640C|nr:DUF1501 domain-containing protein [Verrucomicrobium spinosum]
MNLILRKKNELTRRQMLAKSGCAAMGLTGLTSTLAHLRLMQGALNAQTVGEGYRALVCVFLAGGNDSNNLLVPAGPSAARTDYETGRSILALAPPGASQGVLPLNPTHLAECDPLGGYLGTLGVHPSCAHLQTLFNAGELAFISNVGTLSEPGVTRATYATALKPNRLFSHSDQAVQWQSSVANGPFTSGWGGRIADLIDAAHNTASGGASMSISIGGTNSFLVGSTGQVTTYSMSSAGISSLSGYGSNYASAVNDPNLLFQSSNYKNTQEGWRLRAFENLIQLTGATMMEDAYNSVRMSARVTDGQIGTALQTTVAGGGSTLDSYFNNAFSGSGVGSNNELSNQLKMVARLIAGRSALGNNRQIFFVTDTGYDTHAAQMGAHATRMATLASSLKGFRDSLQSLGVFDNVVTFTASDFSRTFAPNKPDSSGGSDHGWGGNAVVMGGAVKGQRVYGKYPVLKLSDAPDSIDAVGTRGVWIPSTSVDQYAAALARWLGVAPGMLGSIFPNLNRFVTLPTITSGNMDFLEA